MLQIDKQYVDATASATRPEDLHPVLQMAVQLEHATIPPYLLAAYSIKEGLNSPIRAILIDVAKEEMLHMAIVCNVLNALGGRPEIGREGFVPSYPAPLPMGTANGLVVGLGSYSPARLHDLFMGIEMPDAPIVFGGLRNFFNRLLARPELSTIGTFYRTLIEKIGQLGDAAFTGDHTRQVTSAHGAGFPEEVLYPIVDAATAIRALTYIVEDGEGTTSSPLDPSGRYAHYYRFAEIHHGQHLVADPAAPNGFSYSGAAIDFQPDEVYVFADNPKIADLPPDSFERAAVQEFNQAYCDMLRDLERSFDGQPELIRATNSRMARLRGLAASAMDLIDANGNATAVSFEYCPPLP